MIDEDMKFTVRQWLIYFAAWIPYAISYIAVFVVQGVENFSEAFYTMLFNILPAAVTGMGIVYLCRKFSWNLHRRWYFFVAHLLFAPAYALVWYSSVAVALTIDSSARSGSFSPVWFTGYALQWQIFSGLMIYGTIACTIYLLQISQNLRIEERRAAIAETRAAQAEALYAQSKLSALRAQLNPHFLFNTLHSLMALIRYEPQKAEIALEKLAEMLRFVLQEKRESTTNLIRLEDEWQFIQNYLELEKMRLGERLTIESEIDPEALDCLLPAFTLQPLVENAVKHGISPYRRVGTISIKAEKEANNLNLSVADDGFKMNGKPIAESNGLGLKLVRQQLENTYGDRAEIIIDKNATNGFSVRIKLPLG
jgi:sensor histidine kinase YesM